MKYIVTESQYSLILESQQYVEFFQDFIDSRMDYIRRVCDNGADDYEGDVGDESCRQIEELEKVKVTDADWVTIKHSNRDDEQKYMSVKLMIYYSSIRRGDFDADDLTYDLERMIRKSTGMPFILNYESTNTNTRPINDSPGTPPNSNSTLDNAKQSAPTSDGQDIGVNYLPAPNFLDANSEPQGEAPPVDPNFLDANSEPQGEPPLAIDPTSVTIPSNQQIERDF